MVVIIVIHNQILGCGSEMTEALPQLPTARLQRVLSFLRGLKEALDPSGQGWSELRWSRDAIISSLPPTKTWLLPKALSLFPTVSFLNLFLSATLFSPPILCRFCENLAVFSLAHFVTFSPHPCPSPVSLLWLVIS